MRVGPGEYAIKRTTYSENWIVTIIPKRYSVLKCSCPATDLCAHLIGCQIFLGSFDHETKRTKNTTMTLKNNRKAADKTSGRKQPRKLDVGTSIHIPVTPAHINPSAINIEVKAAQVKYFTTITPYWNFLSYSRKKNSNSKEMIPNFLRKVSKVWFQT